MYCRAYEDEIDLFLVYCPDTDAGRGTRAARARRGRSRIGSLTDVDRVIADRVGRTGQRPHVAQRLRTTTTFDPPAR
jgi:hypothetical protein